MALQVVQDWTDAPVHTDGNTYSYRVVRDEDQYQQEVRRADGINVGRFDLPEGVKKDKQSYEVLLRFALSQIAA